jgi:pyruvate,water dikinase
VAQELVPAERAGVLFSCNPIDGADELVIEATWGLGEAVVAGLVTPDRFRLSRDGRVLERAIGVKDVAVRPAPQGGTEEMPVPAELVRRACLEDSDLDRLRQLASRCEQAFGGKQDLEWAFADDDLYLLQRRAITHPVGGN